MGTNVAPWCNDVLVPVLVELFLFFFLFLFISLFVVGFFCLFYFQMNRGEIVIVVERKHTHSQPLAILMTLASQEPLVNYTTGHVDSPIPFFFCPSSRFFTFAIARSHHIYTYIYMYMNMKRIFSTFSTCGIMNIGILIEFFDPFDM